MHGQVLQLLATIHLCCLITSVACLIAGLTVCIRPMLAPVSRLFAPHGADRTADCLLRMLSQANVEMMLEYLPLSQFKAIYVVDLCASLCKQARLRVQAKGWANVHVIEGDACTFAPPMQATAVTFSYSLSSAPPPPPWSCCSAHAALACLQCMIQSVSDKQRSAYKHAVEQATPGSLMEQVVRQPRSDTTLLHGLALNGVASLSFQ